MYGRSYNTIFYLLFDTQNACFSLCFLS